MSWNITKFVSVAVLRRNQILLIRREKGPRKGKWTLPGGKIELNETIQQAMKREVEEETGYVLKDRISDFIPVVETEEGFKDVLPGDRLNFTLLTAAWNYHDRIDAKELITQAWLSPDQMSLMEAGEFTPGLREIMVRILASMRTR